MNVSIIIPSLNPDEKLMKVVRGVMDVGFTDIILVNDGSNDAHMTPFEEAAQLPGVTVLTHKVNKGKGRALKTAFDFCIKNRPDILGVVTVDGDNQHTPKDILACAKKMIELKDHIVLGVRDFSQEQVPWTSRTGNTITSNVFKIVCGIKISDTQTGLRAIPAQHLPMMMNVEGERFEFETEMLLVMNRHGVGFSEVTIETVYINENETSHFKAFRDSFLIYRMILRYAVSSLLSALVDFLVYSGILLIIGEQQDRKLRLFVATVVARVISSVVNFALNKKAVFKSDAPLKKSVKRYYILCAFQLIAAYGLVYIISAVFGSQTAGEIFMKIPVDIFLFIFSFQIQNRWVFKG